MLPLLRVCVTLLCVVDVKACDDDVQCLTHVKAVIVTRQICTHVTTQWWGVVLPCWCGGVEWHHH